MVCHDTGRKYKLRMPDSCTCSFPEKSKNECPGCIYDPYCAATTAVKVNTLNAIGHGALDYDLLKDAEKQFVLASCGISPIANID